jgi:membrane protease YdiL (CAAX protease family)
MKRLGESFWTALFTIATVGFALTAHRESWTAWRWLFLALAGIALCGGWVILKNLIATVFGTPQRNRLIWWIATAVALAVTGSVAYRRLLYEDYFPSSLHWFVLAAMGIGVTEELLWRGWIQGVLTKALEPLTAVLAAAASHTAYKTALFIFPPGGIDRQSPGALLTIAGLTFGFGTVLGLFRLRQGTIAAPIVFHAAFDLLVYGQCETAPWWVL